MFEKRLLNKEAYRLLSDGLQLCEEAVNGELLAYPFLKTSGDPALQTLEKEDGHTQMIHAFLVLSEYVQANLRKAPFLSRNWFVDKLLLRHLPGRLGDHFALRF